MSQMFDLLQTFIRHKGRRNHTKHKNDNYSDIKPAYIVFTLIVKC